MREVKQKEAPPPEPTKLTIYSINFISIWRVASMVEHRAATYPTFDPTWYGPISVELATLEVNFATICASIPVFWPVLTARLDKVFVTREIKIERIHRFETVDEDLDGCGKYGDDVELQCSVRTRSNSNGGPLNSNSVGMGMDGVGNNSNNGLSPHSRATSESSLNRTRSGGNQYGGGGSSNMHYMDEYVAAQVDPLSSMGKVELEISAQPVSRKVSREMSRKNSRAQMIRKGSRHRDG